tara:strand:+ start:835 stop:1578 length:744 start_codon:yes stop_codon:yes gene_type:complete
MILKDQTILLTGGAGDIGRHLTKRFHELSKKVIVIDKNDDGLKHLKNEFKNIECYTCDVTNYNKVGEVIKLIYKTNKIDVLINNAGWIYSTPFYNLLSENDKKHDPAIFKKVIDVNLNSVFNVSSFIVEKMVEQRSKGLIINVSSMSGNGTLSQSAYAAAKAGVKALTAVLAKDLSSFGIRAAAIAPGIVESKATDELSESYKKYWRKQIPLSRFCTTEEIFLCMKFIIENDYYNGKTLPIDGGAVV